MTHSFWIALLGCSLCPARPRHCHPFGFRCNRWRRTSRHPTIITSTHTLTSARPLIHYEISLVRIKNFRFFKPTELANPWEIVRSRLLIPILVHVREVWSLSLVVMWPPPSIFSNTCSLTWIRQSTLPNRVTYVWLVLLCWCRCYCYCYYYLFAIQSNQ